MPNILYTIIIYPITQIIEFTFLFAQKLFKETGTLPKSSSRKLAKLKACSLAMNST